MKRQPQPHTEDPASPGSQFATGLKSVIAHYFLDEAQSPANNNVSEHTLRDIGIDKTVYGNL